VIVLGMSYAPSSGGEVKADGARVARYARGRDYHKLIWKRLRALEAALAALSGRPFHGRTFVDTGPLLERALARRAGLGFIGKNTMLIHPLHGSYLFLATVLTDVELPVDEAQARVACGSCTLCLDACPTQALEPYRLDATRCLSYLTIETRAPVAPELRPAVGGWAFGCDICQEVCPYNRHATPTREDAFAPARGAGGALDLAAVLAMGDTEPYLTAFAGTALTRAKREGLVRNACLAAAHLGRHDLVPRLVERLARDTSPIVRLHAAWALGRLGGPTARHALEDASRSEADPDVRAELARASGEVAA
jgi:epoxyqueuosine reductase